jgi:hypothetical protein
MIYNDFKYLSGKSLKNMIPMTCLHPKKMESSAFYGYIMAGISFGALLLISARYFKVKKRC